MPTDRRPSKRLRADPPEFKIVAPDGDIEWWASNDLPNECPSMRIRWAGYAWTIEYHHRGIKQFWHRTPVLRRARPAQPHRPVFAAFLRLSRIAIAPESVGLKRNHQHSGAVRPIWSTRFIPGSNRVTSKDLMRSASDVLEGSVRQGGVNTESELQLGGGVMRLVM